MIIWCCRCRATVNRVEYFGDRYMRGTWMKVYCHGAEQEELIQDSLLREGPITRVDCFQEKVLDRPEADKRK